MSAGGYHRTGKHRWRDAFGTVFNRVSYSYPFSGNNSSTRTNIVKIGARLLNYIYDGNITAITDVKKLQGDIIGLVNTAGEMVVEYKYDAWGKCWKSAEALQKV